ncbi:MAG: SMC-Scp complex subunit ScpB [Acidobacteria bacterium]|nr:SMC-Scp complex subunit ScpB [Acidobacteriota bacterium]
MNEVTDQDIQPDAPSVDPTPGEADAARPLPPAAADADAAPPSPDQVPDDLKAIVEALIFASPDPLSVKALRKLLPDEPAELVDLAVAALGAQYDHRGGLQLVEVAGGFQIVTRPELHEWVRRLFHERTTHKLSVQALETLAVIAYKQPITAVEITEVRGVNSSGVLGTLIDRKLIKIVGRKPVVGRPFMYATTREFLIRFGLRDLTDLPKVEDMADALGFEPPALGDAEATLPFDGIVDPAAPETADGSVAADEEDGGEADREG